MLVVRNLSAVHGLQNVSFTLDAGRRLALLGPTGSGKSTLLRLIAGLDTPTSGDILWNGQRINELPPHKRGIAFVPQRVALYPHLSVQDNLKLIATGFSRAAEMLKITHLLPRLPNDLSGGEKQRVALAKAVLRNARLWLLDEPFAPLDPVFRDEFREELRTILEDVTLILVSHDPADARALGQLIGILEAGNLIQIGTAEEIAARPLSPFAAAVTRSFGS